MITHTNENDPAFPHEPYYESTTKWSDGGMGLTAREHAAIHLRVPMSGNPWLDEMIEAARKRDTFQALSAAFAGAGVPENQMIAWSKAIMDQMKGGAQ